MITSDLYLCTTHPNGRVVITHHRAWDRKRFMQARINEQAKAKPEERCAISEATEADYEAMNWGKVL